MLEQSEPTAIGFVARGSSARTAASLMNFGNILALVFIPLIIFWFGASMVVYAMNRHHPNPKVGHYTQQAAYRFYAVAGVFVVIATLYPSDAWHYYLISWALAASIIIPWSILDLVRIRKDEWVDLLVEGDDATGQPPVSRA
jgi:preprotein translocase subunit SecG